MPLHTHNDGKPRCDWLKPDNPLYVEYHDSEWGVPLHSDNHWFEMLTLEGAQAGLSSETVLKKRKTYRMAFHDFKPEKVAGMKTSDVERLMKNEGIIRNRLKIESTISNAAAFLNIQKEFGSFDKYIWQFVGGKPIVNQRKSLKDIPASTKESDAISKALKKRGFRFVGTTICYALMQATGLVNDHMEHCFCAKQQ